MGKSNTETDFKRLNAVTISDTYPIPDITSTTLSSLGEAKLFTTLDLTSGFHQNHMKEFDIPKTAFSTLNGKYEFLRLPFGLKNAPAVFQRMIDDVLHIGKICYVFIDDIIVFSKDYESHWRNLRAVFKKLRQAKLQVNLEKTQLLRIQVEFLGYVVTTDGIHADEKKVRAIKDMPPPTNLKELKSFLGMTSYYRKFIYDYAKVSKPLTKFMRGEHAQVKASQSMNFSISLGEEGVKAFDDLKTILASSEVLAFPDLNKAFHLTTDAFPIAYISRSLNKTEENYEMLAIV